VTIRRESYKKGEMLKKWKEEGNKCNGTRKNIKNRKKGRERGRERESERKKVKKV
jgi:hypothetical protein